MIQILMKLLHQTFARALKIKDHSKRPTQKKKLYIGLRKEGYISS